MFPIAYIRKSEKFFKNKDNAKSYLIESKDDHFLYEVEIVLDLQDVMTSKVRDFKIYLTNLMSMSDLTSEIQSIASTAKFSTHTPATATAEVVSAGRGDLFDCVVKKNQIKKSFLTSIDPKKFVDLERYRNNFRGSASDKFGYVSQITTFVENLSEGQYAGRVSPGDLVEVAPVKDRFLQKVESGLVQGVPITETLDLKNLRLKRARKRHVITTEDSNFKEANKLHKPRLLLDVNDKENKKKIIPEYARGKNLRRQRVNIQKTSTTTRHVSFLLKLKHSSLSEAGVALENFGLLLEAQDKKGIVLDRMIVRVNLKKDLDYKLLTLESFSVNISDEGDNIFLRVGNHSKTPYFVDLHNKVLKKDIPFYINSFQKISSLMIPPSKNIAGFKLVKNASSSGRQAPTPNFSGVSTVNLSNLNVPNYFRVTPVIRGIKFDNLYEVGVNSKEMYENAYVPMFVKNTTISGKPAAIVKVDTRNILKKYKKLKFYKKDLSAQLYGNFSDNLKVALDADFKEIGRVRIGTANQVSSNSSVSTVGEENSGKFISIVDTNVEPGRVYSYRVELFEDVGRVQKTYSTSFFQEKIEQSSNVCRVSFIPEESFRSSELTRLKMRVKIIETDAEKVFKSLLKDKYSLFEDDIKEIGDVTTNAIAVKVEKIDFQGCTIDTLEYVSDSRGTTPDDVDVQFDSNLVILEYIDRDISRQKDYLYKATVCLKPVTEIIAGINEEIQYRRGEASLTPGGYNGYRFAGLRRKIASLDEELLYTLAGSLARAGIGGSSRIIDAETSAASSNENIFSNASTGDIFYFSAFRSDDNTFAQTASSSIPNSGILSLELGKVDHYYEKSMQLLNNQGEVKNKFIISFECTFKQDIDHCAIFVATDNLQQFEHCCNMHVDHNSNDEKTDYRLLVEKYGLTGRVQFFMFPVTKYGAILPKVNIGSYRV